MLSKFLHPGSYLPIAAVLTLSEQGCSEPQCPDGFDKMGKICRRHDGGAGTSSANDASLERDESEAEGDGYDAPARATLDAGATLSTDSDTGSQPFLRETGTSAGERMGGAADAAPAAATPDGAAMSDGGMLQTECAPNPCRHGGVCSSGSGRTAACTCAGTGYSGASCDIDIDECSSANVCSNAEYPCTQTMAPGYVCQGQLAEWPMPSAQMNVYSYEIGEHTGVVVDKITSLWWQRTIESATGSWMQAKSACGALSLGGFSDWRLPTRIELESLVDDAKGAPQHTIDSTAFPENPGVPLYWSGSSSLRPSNLAWAVDFVQGGTMEVAKSGSASARCVRSPTLASSHAENRYSVDTVEDTVADSRTGLVWQRSDSGTLRTWSEAMSHCPTLGAGWRVPWIQELRTLVDPTKAQPALDARFLDAPTSLFWSRSQEAARNENAWTVDFTYGAVVVRPKSGTIRVRCVRSAR